MNDEFKQEDRYIVFKVSDLGNSLKGDEIRQLAREYAEQRRLKGKPPLECVVVESDWPEYEPTWRAIEARVTGAQAHPALSQSAQGIKDDIISDLQTQFDTEGITEYDSGDALIRLCDAIAAVEDNFALAQPAPKAVAYLDLGTGGYMDIGTDLTDEALAALPKGRHMLGIVGTYGVDGYVPAQPAPSVPDDMVERAVNSFLSWKLPKDFHPDGGIVFIPTKGRGYDSPYWPCGTNLLNAQQTRDMLRYVLAVAPEVKP